MDDNIKNYLDNLMVPIPGGMEHLMDYQDE